jgi:transposase
MHPALDPASAYADRFPDRPSIRNPVPVMVIPETGELLELVLWDQHGGKNGGIYAKTRFGKTTLLNALRERVTLMEDARMIQINAAKIGDEKAWEPLAAATIVGPAASDETIQAKILGALNWIRAEITRRTGTAAVTGDSVFQPTPADPALILFIDEIDKVAQIPGVTEPLEFIASAGGAASVSLLIAGQSPDQRRIGGGMVRINMAWVLLGVLDRAGEARKAIGAEVDIPDIREYARGERGFFQVYDSTRAVITGRGRGLQMGHYAGQELDEIKRKIIAPRVAAGIRRPLPGPPMEDAVLPQATQAQAGRDQASAMHARIAGIQAQTQQQDTGTRPAQAPPRQPAARNLPAIPGVPHEQVPVLVSLLAAPHGTTAGEAAMATGVSKSVAHEWLAAMRRHGSAGLNRAGRSSRWTLAAQWQHLAPAGSRPGPEVPQEGFTTVHALAEAVHAGLVQVDDTVRALLDQAREIGARTPASRGLFAVPYTPGPLENGDAQ